MESERICATIMPVSIIFGLDVSAIFENKNEKVEKYALH
ncbi:hypothetical protein M2447_002666 [Ereboglobus sp. PH5-10]|nr:hypothetical protein [Ereboglobus sp. PH5-10]